MQSNQLLTVIQWEYDLLSMLLLLPMHLRHQFDCCVNYLKTKDEIESLSPLFFSNFNTVRVLFAFSASAIAIAPSASILFLCKL